MARPKKNEIIINEKEDVRFKFYGKTIKVKDVADFLEYKSNLEAEPEKPLIVRRYEFALAYQNKLKELLKVVAGTSKTNEAPEVKLDNEIYVRRNFQSAPVCPFVDIIQLRYNIEESLKKMQTIIDGLIREYKASGFYIAV